MIYGYARVSTQDQHLHLQTDALKKAGCERIFTEKASAAKERPVLAQLLDTLEEGDTLMVWKMDRLARSLRDLIHLVTSFEERGIKFTSLQDSIDTSTAQGRLFFNLMASLAQFERELIRERTHAGLSAARARGRSGGRPKGLSVSAYKTALAAYSLYQDKDLTVAGIMKQLGIGSKDTLYKYVRHIAAEKMAKATATPASK
jgi:DNA invertase Pin-like site-specific DNA recombinase